MRTRSKLRRKPETPPTGRAKRGRRRVIAPLALAIGLVFVVSSCDQLRFDLNGDIPVDIVDANVLGNISITESHKCGDDRITDVTGAGTVPYGNRKSANFSINLKLNDLCHYVGLIELGFPGESGNPYPICQFVQIDNIVPIQRNGLHGITGFGGTDQSCRSTGPVTLHNFVVLDDKFKPKP